MFKEHRVSSQIATQDSKRLVETWFKSGIDRDRNSIWVMIPPLAYFKCTDILEMGQEHKVWALERDTRWRPVLTHFSDFRSRYLEHDDGRQRHFIFKYNRSAQEHRRLSSSSTLDPHKDTSVFSLKDISIRVEREAFVYAYTTENSGHIRHKHRRVLNI